jgi:hypothetical protein
VLFHHDPDSSDKVVAAIEREAREQFENTWAASEGMVMTVGAQKTRVEVPAEREGRRRETISVRGARAERRKAGPARRKR